MLTESLELHARSLHASSSHTHLVHSAIEAVIFACFYVLFSFAYFTACILTPLRTASPALPIIADFAVTAIDMGR